MARLFRSLSHASGRIIMVNERRSKGQLLVGVRHEVAALRSRMQRTLVGRVWERMLEIEFVDRSVALAGKGFVSFFPLVIVVAAFVPTAVRSSILTTLTHMLGIRGHALVTVREAFASTDDIRRATGLLGLVLTFFFASAFTTALQRLYLSAWRRAPGRKVGAYTRGLAWLPAVLVYLSVLGWWREESGTGVGTFVLVVASLAASSAFWWGSAWFLLEGQVRWRVLIPSALTTGVALSGYGISATIWMPEVVSRNDTQFGFFGVALALVTWLSGASLCILVGACAGPVLAEDDGPVGRLVRGREPGLLVEGAAPSSAPPQLAPRLRDAFRPTTDDESSP